MMVLFVFLKALSPPQTLPGATVSIVKSIVLSQKGISFHNDDIWGLRNPIIYLGFRKPIKSYHKLPPAKTDKLLIRVYGEKINSRTRKMEEEENLKAVNLCPLPTLYKNRIA